MKIGCVLLAAGSGKRFGGDKLAYAIDGVPMIERACSLHAALPYVCRVLIARPSDTFVQQCAKKYAYVLAVNPRHDEGIGTSAALGMSVLEAQNNRLDGALFAVCDQPYLTTEVIEALFAQFCLDPSCIVAPAFNGTRGNPVIFPKTLFSEFSALNGDVGGGAIIRKHEELVRLTPISCAQSLADVDTRKTIGAVLPYADHFKR